MALANLRRCAWASSNCARAVAMLASARTALWPTCSSALNPASANSPALRICAALTVWPVCTLAASRAR
ncbi:hypothetical protein GT370_20205 [Acidocella sp. MX-AZ03]|uniref:hypothetical protein n=1 Tax=Acidocella sp. MX-AZ03 TaxID=2697363 RepID=UPI0022DDCD35|nr:hypothetical protein [Acidocella sp. MX-AZ03]WBO59319.1 hypothetical protein GT370_20205 [Acidocella sp. MX-AZ03]